MSGRQKSDAKREAILEGAAAEFAHRDFHEVLMDDVAARAGVGKGTLYRYFPNKETLLLAVVFRGLDDFHDRLVRTMEREAPLREILEAVFSGILSYFWDRGEYLNLLARYEHRIPESEAEGWERRRAETREGIVAALQREVRAGTLRPIDADLTAELMLGMLRTAVQLRSGQQSPESVAREIVSLVLHGVSRNDAAAAQSEPLQAVGSARGGHR
jgi:TetR/AcrR family fatty acid metabolism transcriptional regulator